MTNESAQNLANAQKMNENKQFAYGQIRLLKITLLLCKHISYSPKTNLPSCLRKSDFEGIDSSFLMCRFSGGF